MNKLHLIIILLISAHRLASQKIPDHEERLMHSYDSTVMIHFRNIESEQMRPFQNSKIALSTAVAGGGYRATFFALGVMLELENIPVPHKTGATVDPADTVISKRYPYLAKSSNLLNEIDYFSTVSGGGFAVGFYLSSIQSIESFEYQRQSIPKKYNLNIYDSASLRKKIRNIDFDGRLLYENFNKWFLLRSGPLLRQAFKYTYIKYDYNSHYIAKKTGSATNFAPKLYKGNSRTLIKHLITKPHICTEANFRRFFLLNEYIDSKSLFPKSGSIVNFPFLVSNATIVGNVLPFRFTPNIFENFKTGRDTFNLEFALIASASFPGFFANQIIKCNIGLGGRKNPSYIHLMDGGAFDNSGVRTAIELLNLDISQPKYLLLIDARGADIASSYTLRNQDFNLTSVVDLVTDLQYLLVDSYVNHFHFSNVVLNLKSILNERDKNAPFQNPQKYTYKYLADTLIKEFGYNEGVYSDTIIDHLLLAYSREGYTDQTEAKKRLCYIYEICSNIKTNLYLEEWEKRILILAGKIAVRKNMNIIKTRFAEFW